MKIFYESELGKIYCGDLLELMGNTASDSVDLIMTSPPFGLVRKKAYGNVDAEKYLAPFSILFCEIVNSYLKSEYL